MAEWMDKVRDIVSASQETAASHDRFVKDLRKIYDAADKKAFATEIKRLLVYPLSFAEKSSFVNNCLAFFAKFIVSTAPENVDLRDDEDDGAAKKIDYDSPTALFECVLRFIINILPSTCKNVRMRGCQFIHLFLEECANQDRSDAIGSQWDNLNKALRTRCMDKVTCVRSNAVAALSKMQQPKDPDCTAVAAIMYLMRHDPSSEVRSQCASLISSTKKTFEIYLERCRDKNETVRQTVYKQIGLRKLFRFLKVEQRLTILQRGIADPAEQVRTVCERYVITSWLNEVGNDIPELIRRLDLLFTNKKTCEKLLDVLFEQKPPQDFVDTFALMTERWEEDGWLTPERVFCLRYFVGFITLPSKKKDKEDKRKYEAAAVEEWMETLLPSLFSLVEFVEGYMKKDIESEDFDLVDGTLHRNFIMSELIELLILADKSDAAGRNRIEKMIETVVPVVESGVLPSLVRLHLDMHRNIERTIEWMAEMISDWTVVPTSMPPLANGFADRTISYLQSDGLAVEENAPDDEQMAANLFKSLTVLSQVLKSASVNTLTTTLRSLYENLVLPAIKNEDPATRNLAFLCLGLSCLLDQSLASKHAHVFLLTLNVDVDMVRKTAVEVLFDFLLVFRENFVAEIPQTKNDETNDGENGKKTACEIVMELRQILDSDDTELHDIVAEGIAKIGLFVPKLLKEIVVE